MLAAYFRATALAAVEAELTAAKSLLCFPAETAPSSRRPHRRRLRLPLLRPPLPPPPGLRNLLGILESRIHHPRCRLVVHSAVGSWPAARLVAVPAVGLASASSPAR